MEFVMNIILSSVRMATPLIFLALAELYSQRAGLARQYVAEALAGEPELTVTGVELDGNSLQVRLEYRGEELALTMETGGW